MKTYPTLEEIKAKKGEFREKIKKNEKPKRNEELIFLSNIKLEIKQAIQNGASNQKIVKIIKEVYGVSVSLAKFADFCVENNIATNARKRKAKTDIL
ncbi:hypothetical protein LS74_010100 [Helicobacter magdeburgensis]|uniref:Uncharacterized protein n=1 Tax=Helicobacter magdeburgensis TaxID=471858 RepID=A0A4V6I168_9HELI|nr:hypothetical protein [Helicobacter magdeburgensis]TLD91132.1 hypothetical protein LS74_010100 [Helicobacter magdeburgensis]